MGTSRIPVTGDVHRDAAAMVGHEIDGAMYADPAATETMSASARADVARRHETLHQDLAGSGEMSNGAGLAHPRDPMTMRRRLDGSTRVLPPPA
jgi:hypothetical protein